MSGSRRNELLAKLVPRETPIGRTEARKLGSLTAPSGERGAYSDAVAEARGDGQRRNAYATISGNSSLSATAVVSGPGRRVGCVTLGD